MTAREEELLIAVADAVATICTGSAHILVNGRDLKGMGENIARLTRVVAREQVAAENKRTIAEAAVTLAEKLAAPDE